jgi:hypothetical protein
MHTIWAAAKGKPAITVAIDELNLLDAVVWFGGPKNVVPTIRRVAERARDIFNADFNYPIIMTRSGDVLDGAHRTAKAYLQGFQTITAVVLEDYPQPGGIVGGQRGRQGRGWRWSPFSPRGTAGRWTWRSSGSGLLLPLFFYLSHPLPFFGKFQVLVFQRHVIARGRAVFAYLALAR